MPNHPLFFSGSTTLTPAQQIAYLQERATRAAAGTFRNRRTGTSEQYVASYFLLEALDAQVADLVQAQRLECAGRSHV